MTGLPFWAMHNVNDRTFTVPKTFDGTRVGAYPVSIESTVTFYDTWEKLSNTTLTATSDFTIYIEPCQVASLTPLNPIPKVEYTIGNFLGAVSGAYEFVQTPDCGYDVEIIITG